MNEVMKKEVIENALSQVGLAHMPLFLFQDLIREKAKRNFVERAVTLWASLQEYERLYQVATCI